MTQAANLCNILLSPHNPSLIGSGCFGNAVVVVVVVVVVFELRGERLRSHSRDLSKTEQSRAVDN